MTTVAEPSKMPPRRRPRHRDPRRIDAPSGRNCETPAPRPSPSSARGFGDGTGLVSPSLLCCGKPLSNMTLTKVLKDTGLAERATVQSFFSSIRDWFADAGKLRKVAEAALAHIVAASKALFSLRIVRA